MTYWNWYMEIDSLKSNFVKLFCIKLTFLYEFLTTNIKQKEFEISLSIPLHIEEK